MNRPFLKSYLAKFGCLCSFLPPMSPNLWASEKPKESQNVTSNSCKSISLFTLKEQSSDSDSLNLFFEKFEKSFLENNGRDFKSLIHPSLTRESKNGDIFNSTVDDFGLNKVKLTRSFAYRLDFESGNDQSTECDLGKVRGVVGPKEQYAVIYQFLGGNEQVRIFTIVSKVPLSHRKIKDQDWGIVMMHAQIWSHGKQTPQVLAAEATKWALLGEPVTAWALSKAATRILEANPYFEPTELSTSLLQTSKLEETKPNILDLNDDPKIKPTAWKFEDLTVVFQSKGLEIGLKVRMPKPEIPVNEQIETCKKMGRVFSDRFPGVKQRFSGFECLTYLPGENLNNTSESGSQFHKWQN